MSRRRHFHPQRLFPRYGRLAETASRIPGGLEVTLSALGSVILDRSVAYSEDPTESDLHDMRIGVVGFPRTGTTFMLNAINLAFDDPRACFKNHDILAVPGLTAAGHPVLIPLRDPTDVIVSWMIYNNDPADPALARDRVATFIAWHRLARRMARVPDVHLVEFSVFSRDPESVLRPLMPSRDHESTEVRADDVAADLDSSPGEAVVSLQHGHVPSSSRDALKPPYLEALDHPSVRAGLDRAESLLDDMRATTRSP